MLLPAKMRSILLSVALIATVAAVFMVPSSEPDTPSVVSPTTHRSAFRHDTQSPELRIPEAIVIRPGGAPHENPFFKPVPVVAVSLKSITAPAEPPQIKAAPPPLPYVYLGRMEDDGKIIIFLGKGSDSLSVHIGETVDGAYLVQEMNEKSITLVYLPLDVKQMLMIGDSN